MPAIAFDSLAYYDKLKSAGFPDPQARAQAELMREHTAIQNAAIEKALKGLHEENTRTLASKNDIQDVRNEISELRAEMHQEFAAVRAEIAELRSDMEQEFAAVRAETRQEFAAVRAEMLNMKHDILKWMMGMLIAQSALLISAFGIGLVLLDKIP